jgi:hypothetical protein
VKTVADLQDHRELKRASACDWISRGIRTRRNDVTR